RPRLVVSRTMSKAFGLAGARVGYIAADQRVIDAMLLTRLPYHLSSITQVVAETALRHRESLLKGVEEVKVQRDRIVKELRHMQLTVADSDSNFVLFRAPYDQSQSLWERLLDRGVLIRDVDVEGYLRVTAGSEIETTKFLDAMEDSL